MSLFSSGDKTSLKRSLDDSNKMAGQLEESNLSQMKEADELRSNIRELEAARQESRREIQQLHNQVISLNNKLCAYFSNYFNDELKSYYKRIFEIKTYFFKSVQAIIIFDILKHCLL